MNANEAMLSARLAKVRVSVVGGELNLTASVQPVDSVIEALRRHKGEIVVAVMKRFKMFRQQVTDNEPIPLLCMPSSGYQSDDRCFSCGETVGAMLGGRCEFCITAAYMAISNQKFPIDFGKKRSR